MKYIEELSLNIEEVIKQEQKLRCKNRSAVTDNRVWETVILHYHVDNCFRQPWSINGDFNWLVIYNFGQVVDNDKTWFITVAFLVSG